MTLQRLVVDFRGAAEARSAGGSVRGPQTARRKLGKREKRRRARRLADQIVDLSAEGHSPAVVASSVGLPELFVREALERAAAVRTGGGSIADA